MTTPVPPSIPKDHHSHRWAKLRDCRAKRGKKDERDRICRLYAEKAAELASRVIRYTGCVGEQNAIDDLRESIKLTLDQLELVVHQSV